MSDRGVLGAADVSDAALAAMLGADAIESSTARPIDYALEAMTTGGRFWVEGTAIRAGRVQPFRLAVKIAQTVTRSPIMAAIPQQFRELTAQHLPWEVEPAVYRSGLADALPDGLRLPRCYAVNELDAESAAIWLEAVEPSATGWTADDSARAAYLLGRLAAAPAVQAIADDVGHRSAPQQARVYLHGRLEGQYLAAYREGAIFEHPAVARHYAGDLRERLMRLVALAPALVEEIEGLPLLAAHGDAAPNNLLPVPAGLAVIDWAFFGRGRVGFDLSQLLMSQIELGEVSADELPERQSAALAAYGEGLAAEGFRCSAQDLHRAHAIQVAIAIGIAAVPLEQLNDHPKTLEPLVRHRARALEHQLAALDL